MTWASATDVRYILIEATSDQSYWKDDAKIDPYIEGAERYIISRLAPYFGWDDLTDWQSDATPPGILIEISKHRAAAEILNTSPFDNISEIAISREKKMADDIIDSLIVGNSAIYDSNGVEYRVTVGGVVSINYDADEFPFPVNPSDPAKKFRW